MDERLGPSVRLGDQARVDKQAVIHSVHGDVVIGGSAASRVVAAQLPRTPADFAGRVVELIQIGAALPVTDGGVGAPVVMLHGPPGVGKSALAVRVAHEMADQFPGGRLYVNLRGADDRQRLEPSQVLDAFLRALGVPAEEMPADPGEREPLYQSVLSSRRVLVVLDNAATTAQVAPLLPASTGSAALVTSRTMLPIEGAQQHRVGLLDPAACAQLIEAMVGQRAENDPEGVAELARLCGYLPLAVRIAAGRLIRRPDWPLRRLTADLADEHSRLDMLADQDRAVRASFALSYADLPAPAARAFRLLAVPTAAEVRYYAAGWLFDLDESATDELLGQLVEAQLIEPVGPGRYQLHDLLRLYAHEQLSQQPAEEAQEALHRYLNGYAAIADAAARQLRPASEQSAGTSEDDRRDRAEMQRAVLVWFQDELSTLTTAIDQAADAAVWEAVFRLVGPLDEYLAIRTDWPLHERVLHRGLTAHRAVGDRRGEGATLNSLGNVYGLQGRFDEAISAYEQALAISRMIGERLPEGQTLGNLGNVYSEQRRFDEAISAHEQALAIFREHGDRHREGQSMNNLGLVYADQGRFDEAISAFEQDLAICRELGDRRGEGLTLGNLGNVYGEQRRFDEAISAYEQALAVCQEFGDRRGEGRALGNLGNVYGEQGRPDEAISAYEQDLAICRELGDRRGEGQTLGNLGNVYAEQDRLDEAISAFEQALAIFREHGDRHREGRALGNLGNVYAEQGRLDEAISAFEQALAAFEEVSDETLVAKVRQRLVALRAD